MASEALLLLVAWTRGVPMGQYMAKAEAEAQRRQLSGIRSADAQAQSFPFGGRRLSIGPWGRAPRMLRCGGTRWLVTAVVRPSFGKGGSGLSVCQ